VDCSKHMVDGISTDARTADLSTRQLRDTAQAMNGIVQTIMRVASQTNLLALNATIEAARAGPAGRGFSVVATEVKALAGQTNAATRQISEQIAEMQRVSETVAGSLTTISTAVMKVQGYVTDVAKAVDAQSAATRAISTNMQDAADQVGNISASLDKLAHGF
jgi:methyl-accepting chemotaxis protein